jgi:hypothetical protein
MSGKSSKVKGWVAENEIKHMHLDLNIFCKRVPLSGAAAGYKGDLEILDEFVAEVKKRAGGNGFATIERWMGDNDLLFLKRNRQLPLVVMDWATYVKLMRGYKSNSLSDDMLAAARDMEDEKEEGE